MMIFFEQAAVAGEGPHAQELDLRDFIAAVRDHPGAPVDIDETEEHGVIVTRAWLRVDLLSTSRPERSLI